MSNYPIELVGFNGAYILCYPLEGFILFCIMNSKAYFTILVGDL
jgi:hypothetical protein